MKFLRFLLILGALGAAGIFGYELVNELKKPSEGTMEEVVVMEEEVVMEEVTVMTEEETMEEMNQEPIVVVEEVVEEVFTPLSFDGKLSKFAKANGGTVIKLKGSYLKAVQAFELTGISSKGVKVNGDLYFKAAGDLYVINSGKLIKLN